MTDNLVCAWCDVEARDDKGELVTSWTKCAYCGRTEAWPQTRSSNANPSVGNGHIIYEQDQIDSSLNRRLGQQY
jgi:hypothetical protein